MLGGALGRIYTQQHPIGIAYDVEIVDYHKG